jgi:hypothetical protein
MTARAEAQVLRLSRLYALADVSDVVRLEHLQAALELWRYCFDSAKYLFGDRLGHPVADEIMAALRRTYPASVTRTEISDLFKRHRSASQINEALDLRKQHHLAWCEEDRGTGGRPIERWVSNDNTDCEKSELSGIIPRARDLNSHVSLVSRLEAGDGSF